MLVITVIDTQILRNGKLKHIHSQTKYKYTDSSKPNKNAYSENSYKIEINIQKLTNTEIIIDTVINKK